MLVEDFVTASAHALAPEHYRRWAGLAMVGALLSREVYTEVYDQKPAYGNLFIMLTGVPGSGKSEAIGEVRDLLVPLQNKIVLLPDSVTPPRFDQVMCETFTGADFHRSVVGPISEIGTFIPSPDTKFFQGMARLWDCPPVYESSFKTLKDEKADTPYFSLLAGVQPAWFAEGMGVNTFQMGLTARMIMVYSGKRVRRPYTGSLPVIERPDPYAQLRPRIRDISLIKGRFTYTPGALAKLQAWDDAGFPPEPTDPLLEAYNVRRNHHCAKLSLIAAAAAHPDDHRVKAADLDYAMQVLFEAEKTMPDAIVAAGGNTIRSRELVLLKFIRGAHGPEKKGVPEWRVRAVLSRLVEPYMMKTILDEMVARRDVKAMGKEPNRTFIPLYHKETPE